MGCACGKQKALLSKASQYLEKGQFEDAVVSTDLALQRHASTEPEGYYIKARALAGLEKYNDALSNFNKAIQIKSEFSEAHLHKGVVLHFLQQPENAIRCFDRALELNPSCKNAFNMKGVALTRLGKYEEAIQNYDRALQLDPNYEIARSNKRQTRYEMRGHQKHTGNNNHVPPLPLGKLSSHRTANGDSSLMIKGKGDLISKCIAIMNSTSVQQFHGCCIAAYSSSSQKLPQESKEILGNKGGSQ